MLLRRNAVLFHCCPWQAAVCRLRGLWMTFQSALCVCGAVGMWVGSPWRRLLRPLVTGCLVPLGQTGPRRALGPGGAVEAGPRGWLSSVCLLISKCYRARKRSSPPRKKKEQETVQKGIMR